MLSRMCLSAFMLGAANIRRNKNIVEKLLVPIVPPPLPPYVCIYGSGLIELGGGVLLAMPGCEHDGAALIMLLLIAVFPANIYHAMSREAHARTGVGPPLVYWRLLIQFLWLAWATWHL